REDRFGTAHEMRVAIEQWLTQSRDTTSISEIGTYVASLFAEDRMRVRALIDRELKRLAAGEYRAQLATLEIARPTTSQTDVNDTAPPPPLPRLPAAPPSSPPSGLHSGTASLGTLGSGTAPDPTPPPLSRPLRSRWYLGAGLVAGGALATIIA